MQLDREYILRMIKGRSAGAVVVEGSEGGGGGVTLGPLLTSLNAEAMPTAEGYLHWTGSAWAFDTPTGGDPVDLTPYAQKTWVQDNFAYKSDLTGLLTKADADGYYAPISFVKPYLPLAAGSSYPLTGSLYITGNAGITWVGGYGMLCFKPTSSWSGVNENQWGVGSHAAQGVIRSSLELKRYDGTYQYTIYDSSNLDPLNYIRKDGGTVTGTLNVKTQLNIQSDAGANKISFDGTTPNIDIASGGQLTFDVDSHIAHDATNDRLVIHGNNGILIDSDTYIASGGQLTFDVDSHIAHDATNDRLVIHGNNGILIDSDTYVGSVASGNQVATKSYVTGQGYLKGVSVYGSALTPDANMVVNIPYADTNVPGVIQIGTGLVNNEGHTEVDTTAIATRTWADGRYLPLTAGENKPLTGSLYQVNGAGLFIKDTGGTGRMAVYMNNQNQFFVGFGMRQGGYEGYFDSNIIYLRTGSTGTTMTLDASHNVGIGTTSPAEKLDVAGNVKANGATLTNLLSWNVANADNIVISNNKIQLSVSGTPHNIVLFEGSTASLTSYAKFYERPMVKTGTNNRTPVYTNVALVSEVEAKQNIIHFLNTNSNNSEVDFSYLHLPLSNIGGGHASLDLSAYVTSSALTTALGAYLPLSAGSSKPLTGDLYLSEDLVINNEKYIYFKNHSGTLCDALSHSYDEGSGIDTLYLGFDFRKSSHSTEIYGNKLTLYTGTTARERMVITSGGNVGIGTNAPDYKLDVSGVIRATEGMMVRNGSSDAIGLDPTGLFFNKAQEGGSPIPASIFAFTWDSDSQKVVVSKDGNMIVTGKMAVGTTAFDTSNAKLQVTGNMFATGSITSKSNHGNVSLGNGNISATNLYITTVVFGDSNNDAAIYVEGGHIKARNASGTIITIV